MIKKLWMFCLSLLFIQNLISGNAPVTTAGTVVVPTATSAVVPIRVTGFTDINSFSLELHFDPAIASITNVSTSIPGGYNTNTSTPGILIIGWYTYPALSGVDTLFLLTFSKIATGVTQLTWYNEGNSCYYSNSSYEILNDLPTSTYYINGSLTFGQPLFTDFMADNLAPLKNATVHFTDMTSGSPTSWTWTINRPTFTYVNGTNNHSQNPDIQFTDGGTYTITLSVTKPGFTGTITKTDYIRVGLPGLWTGITSSDWSTATNWENWAVPSVSTNVVIPSSAPNWPVFTGNLILGENVHDITLNGSSQITVNGNLIIRQNRSMNVASNALVKISGDWTNEGTFVPGTGTIQFIGNNISNIFAGNVQVVNNFFNLTISKNNAILLNHTDINVLGDLLISQ